MLTLNDSLSTGVSVGLGVLGSSAAIADIDPSAGAATFTDPPDADVDGNGASDLEEVVRSLDRGTIGQFTPFTVGTGTSYVATIGASNHAFPSVPGGDQRRVRALRR